MQPLLNIGMRAARRAGDLIVRSLSRLDSLKIDSKGRNDFVTDIDRKAEADIIATIHRSHPNHAILAEESGRSGDNEYVWIIDPLDGTTNFLHGFPTFAVSIAVEHRGRLQHAVVYDPMRQEFFTASRGDGAQLEGKKIRVSTQRTLEGSLIGTGFPFRANVPHVDEYLAMLKLIMSSAAGVSGPSAASNSVYTFGLPATIFGPSAYSAPVSVPTRPPASWMSRVPAAVSQGDKPNSQNPSMRPAAT